MLRTVDTTMEKIQEIRSLPRVDPSKETADESSAATSGWRRLLGGPWPGLVAAGSWVAICLGAAGWLYLQSTSPLVCRPDNPYVIFCRAHQADDLLGHLGQLGLVFVLGSVLMGSISLFLPRGDNRLGGGPDRPGSGEAR